MKKGIALLYCVIFLFIPVFAQEYTPSIKKYYCQATQIQLSDNAILLHLNNNIFEIDSLSVDQGGIYFIEDALRCTYCRKTINPKNTCDCPRPHA